MIVTVNFLATQQRLNQTQLLRYLNDELEIYPKVYARNNWWGSGESTYPAGE